MIHMPSGARRLSGALAVAALSAAVAVPGAALAGGKQHVNARITGGGSFFTSTGVRVTHGFELRCNAADPRQNLEINFQGNHFHLERLVFASCRSDGLNPAPPRVPGNVDVYDGIGFGRFNGTSPYLATWEFTDHGEPGRNDTAAVRIQGPCPNATTPADCAGAPTVLSVGTTPLRNGNHQFHRLTGGGPSAKAARRR